MAINTSSRILIRMLECTMDQELVDVAAYVPDRHHMCTHQVAAPLCVK